MDHYPPVVNSCDPVEVPYLGGVYDNADFAGYPARRGIDVEALARGDLQNSTPETIAEFLQTWFFFGMIRAFVEVDVAFEDLVKSDAAGNKFLTTKKLLVHLGRWRARVEKERAAVPPRQGEILMAARALRIEGLLMASFKHWLSLRPDDADSLLDPRLSLCLQLLGGLLEFSVSWSGFIDLNRNKTPWRFSDSPWLTRRMVRRGWCPVTCERLHSPGDLPVQYYASLLEPPAFPSAPAGPDSHLACTNRYMPCQMHNVDPNTYQTQHVNAGCQCEFISVDRDTLCDIITRPASDGHSIPLVSWTAGEDVVKLIVAPRESGMRYTALSHVWIDGMGNENGNSLPRCQVRRLFRWIEEHWAAADGEQEYQGCDEKRYLWIDTLCVPVATATQSDQDRQATQEARKRAIRSMRHIYEQARTTLVVDAYLLHTTVYARWEEKLTRVSASPWLQRMWTLQEALLSRRIYVQWAEMAELIQPKGDRQNAWEVREVWNSYHNDISYSCGKFNFAIETVAGDGPSSLMYLMFLQMKNRTTSKPLDEAVILATAMQQTGEPLRILQGFSNLDERLHGLWRMLLGLGVPAAVLFLPGDKLTRQGYRWAPKSLSHCGFIGMPNDVRHTLSPRFEGSELVGVAIRQPGLLLQSPTERVTCVLSCTLDGTLFYIRRSKIMPDDWADLDLRQVKRLGLLLAQNPSMHAGGRQRLEAAVGALVSISDDPHSTNPELTATWLRQVSIFRAGSRFDVGANPPWLDVELRERERQTVEATHLAVDQEWLLT